MKNLLVFLTFSVIPLFCFGGTLGEKSLLNLCSDIESRYSFIKSSKDLQRMLALSEGYSIKMKSTLAIASDESIQNVQSVYELLLSLEALSQSNSLHVYVSQLPELRDELRKNPNVQTLSRVYEEARLTCNYINLESNQNHNLTSKPANIIAAYRSLIYAVKEDGLAQSSRALQYFIGGKNFPVMNPYIYDLFFDRISNIISKSDSPKFDINQITSLQRFTKALHQEFLSSGESVVINFPLILHLEYRVKGLLNGIGANSFYKKRLGVSSSLNTPAISSSKSSYARYFESLYKLEAAYLKHLLLQKDRDSFFSNFTSSYDQFLESNETSIQRLIHGDRNVLSILKVPFLSLPEIKDIDHLESKLQSSFEESNYLRTKILTYSSKLTSGDDSIACNAGGNFGFEPRSDVDLSVFENTEILLDELSRAFAISELSRIGSTSEKFISTLQERLYAGAVNQELSFIFIKTNSAKIQYCQAMAILEITRVLNSESDELKDFRLTQLNKNLKKLKDVVAEANYEK